MKKSFYLLLTSVFLFGFCNQAHLTNQKTTDEFLADLTYANSSLRGDLILFDYEDDLSSLTYEHYLELLKKNESKNKSTEGITEVIQQADKHLFATKKNSFLIAIYSKKLSLILYDDAISDGIDSVLFINGNMEIPDLKEFISNTKYESGFETKTN